MTRARLSSALAVGVYVCVAASGAARAQGKGDDRLLDAYKREFAFLESEKRALTARLTEEKAESGARIKRAKDAIAALQARVVSAASEAQRVEDQTLEAERELDRLDRSEDLGEDIVTRARSAYERLGIAMPEADLTNREQLRSLLTFTFSRMPAALTTLGQVRLANGAYFDAAGQKIEGHVLRVGDVASYGIVDGAMGPLAPAGNERLQLWPAEGGAAAAAALANGTDVSRVPIFLYESLDKGVERKAKTTFAEYTTTGGPIAWVIVGVGGLALLLILMRALILAFASRGEGVIAPVLRHLENDRVQEALALTRGGGDPVRRVLAVTVGNFDKPRAQVEDLASETVLHEQRGLSRFGALILVLAAVAPLLGLLGTVTGMISTFDIITEFGTGNPKLLSGGISEALITTEYGLLVAIPTLLLGHVLNGWSDRIRDRLDAAALSVINRAAGILPPDPDDVAVAVPARGTSPAEGTA